MNTGKQINAMVAVLFVTLIVVGVYTIWDPFRSDAAKTYQDDRTAEFGGQTFTLNCRLCHGDRGQGGQAGGRLLAAPPLDTDEFKGIENGSFSQSKFDQSLLLVKNTITCGRAGTQMPTWGASQGGTLSEEQIRQLVVLITEGQWDFAQEHADETDAAATNHATLNMPDGGALSADATDLTVSNAGPFTLGQYIRIDDERLRVLPIELVVERGVDGTTAAEHALGAQILRGGAPVLSAGTPALLNGAVVLEPGPGASLAEKVTKDATALPVGDVSVFNVGDTLQVGDEAVRVTAIARGIPTTGQVLAKEIGRTPKTILISGSSGVKDGDVIRVDSEPMNVNSISDDGKTGAELDANASATDSVISVNKPTFFKPKYQFKAGNETMQVIGPVDTNQTLSEAIGIAQNELEISGTENIEQGMIIRMDDELFKVTEIVQPARVEIDRAQAGSQAASHAGGTVVLKVVEATAAGQPPADASTGQSLIANIDDKVTTVDVTGAAKLAVDQQFTLDSETVKITKVDPAIIKVQRAVDGTKKAEHSRRAAIYDGNKLGVQRGVNGTTASAHEDGDNLTMTALHVKRAVENSEVAEHSKNTEVFLRNQLTVARGLLTTKAAEHTAGSPVLNFVSPPDNPATNLGPTCSSRAVQPITPGTPSTPPPNSGAAVGVSLTEYSVTPDPTSIAAGAIQFNVTNSGAGPHNLRVAQTDLPSDGLPESGSQVDESQVNIVARSTGTAIAAGGTESVAATLTAGKYVLFCNVPTHYGLGMHVEFTVQ